MEVAECPPLVGMKLLRFIGVLLGWSLIVAIFAGWWWAIEPLPNCTNSAAAQHMFAEREGIGGECTQAAIDRTKTTLASSAVAWSIGTAIIAVLNWAEPWRRMTARPF